MADQEPLLHADGEELQTLRNNVKVIVQLVTDQVQNAPPRQCACHQGTKACSVIMSNSW
jgi:hypothetical protein